MITNSTYSMLKNCNNFLQAPHVMSHTIITSWGVVKALLKYKDEALLTIPSGLFIGIHSML